MKRTATVIIALSFCVSLSLSLFRLEYCPAKEKCLDELPCDFQCAVCPRMYSANLTSGLCLIGHCRCVLWDEIHKVPMECLDSNDLVLCDKKCKSVCDPSCKPYGRCMLDTCTCDWR